MRSLSSTFSDLWQMPRQIYDLEMCSNRDHDDDKKW